jgi:hypothetical protein
MSFFTIATQHANSILVILLPCFLMGALCAVIGYRIHARHGGALVEWLNARPRRFQALSWLVNAGLLSLFSLLTDLIDVSAVLDGQAREQDIYLFPIWIAVGAMYCFVLVIFLDCHARGDQTIATLRSELAAREQHYHDEATVLSAKLQLVESQYSKYQVLSRMLLKILGHKWERLLVPSNAKCDIDEVKRILGPLDQMAIIVESMYQFVRDDLLQVKTETTSLRITFYEPSQDKEYLEATASYDGSRTNVVTKPNHQHRNRFRLNGSWRKDCLPVWCSLQTLTEPVLISDADAAHQDPLQPYHHLDDQEALVVKSLVAYRCRLGQTDTGPLPVIVIDSSTTNLFKLSDESREILTKMLNRLSYRLCFERDMYRKLQTA